MLTGSKISSIVTVSLLVLATVLALPLRVAAKGTSGDYDGDGKTDKAVWRPSTGIWYIIPSSAPTTFTATQWGVSEDIPEPGDYDGDGKTDMAVWRPSTGTWYILPSSKPGTFIAVQWGVNGDIPVPGDYDGDGKTDMAVWRPSTGTWYILPSSKPGTFVAVQWGVAGDIPVPGDYDGDGKTDMAVWRPSTGTWYAIPSSAPTTFTVNQWGITGDIPVPGDYDGDGKTDMAVWRPSSGTWYVIPSSAPTTFTVTQWGVKGDIPVPGDYDGDGKTDRAVWRPSNGTWYVIPSSSTTFSTTQWGTSGDAPVETSLSGLLLGSFAFTTVASQVIGPAGGIVSVSDPTSPLFGAQVSIPAGALSANATVAIDSVSPMPLTSANEVSSGPLVDFEPSGLQFTSPVTISLPSISSFSAGESDLIFEFSYGGFSPGPNVDQDALSSGQMFDQTTNALSYLTNHFSVRGRLRNTNYETLLQAAALTGFGVIPYISGRCNCPDRSPGNIQAIVIHSTHDPDNPPFPSVVHYAATNTLPAFAHYYIDRTGAVIQIAPDLVVAPHTKGTFLNGTNINGATLGIEMYAPQSSETSADYTAAQKNALLQQTTKLMQLYGITRNNVFRHKDLSNDPNHQDPYGWSDQDWVNFVSQLPRPPNTFALKVTKAGTGTGDVTSSPLGIVCSIGCSAALYDFPSGSQVTLTATPDFGSVFTGWMDACSGNGSCVITGNTDLAVTATFDSDTVGSIAITSATCSGSGGNDTISTTVAVSGPVASELLVNINPVVGDTLACGSWSFDSVGLDCIRALGQPAATSATVTHGATSGQTTTGATLFVPNGATCTPAGPNFGLCPVSAPVTCP